MIIRNEALYKINTDAAVRPTQSISNGLVRHVISNSLQSWQVYAASQYFVVSFLQSVAPHGILLRLISFLQILPLRNFLQR